MPHIELRQPKGRLRQVSDFYKFGHRACEAGQESLDCRFGQSSIANQSDSVIIPVQPEYLSVVGMTQLFDTIGQVKKQVNPQLQIEGVLITLANMRTNLAKNTVNIIKEAYGGSIHIFPYPIPYSTKVKEASAAGKSIFEYDSRGNAAYAYEQLAKEVSQLFAMNSVKP